MSKTYRPYEPNQLFLMPPSLLEWLPSDHMVHVLREVLEIIDLTPITSSYEEEDRGYPPYHPKVMTGILLYGYCHGITSSRKLEKHCVEDVAYRVLAANNRPDFRTINTFRRRHLGALPHLFAEVLHLCQKAGMVSFGHVSLDGTKIKANASKHKAMSYARMKTDIVRLENEIASLLKRADRTDAEEDKKYGVDKRGDELPEELARRETRLAKILQAKKELEEEAKRQKHDPKDPPPTSKPSARIKTEVNPKTGKRMVSPDAQRNFTDPESRIMPYQGSYVQGYNPQLLVDSKRQVIVATALTNCPNDKRLLSYMLTRLPRKPKILSADAGYDVAAHEKTLRKSKIDAYIAVAREKHGIDTESPCVRGRPPEDLSFKQRMARKVQTKKGRKIYARRKVIAEPAIGQIKHAMGFRQFSLRGAWNAEAEWFLVCAAHNFRKLFKELFTKPKLWQVIAT